MQTMVREFIEKLVPQTLIGHIEYRSQIYKKFYGFGPMNGQTSRMEICRKIFSNLGITKIIETGTYRGGTTSWLAQFNLPITTIDAKKRDVVFSKLRLSKFPNIEIFHGNSVDVLKTILNKERDANMPYFYYLDAHWYEYLPLSDELHLIRDRNPAAIILIDDFQVPDDSGYKFDDYGDGKSLTLEYLARNAVSDFDIFFPKTPAIHETGVTRGYCVLDLERVGGRKTCGVRFAAKMAKTELNGA
ncbi:MAG TPA: hypothetical protein VIE66_09715 [Methylocella sp.]|jgi:hypothetical protein